MKNKLKNRKFGAIILASAIVISSAVGVSAPGITDTKSDMTVSMPELTEDSVNNLLESSAAETRSSSEKQISLTEIDSVDGLKSLVDSINNQGLNCKGKTINLYADIVWSGEWEPIKAFNGTFNGNGYTISGLNNEFISYANKDSQIMELNIESEIATTGNIGGIVSVNQGTISNCTFLGSIMSDDDQLNIEETGCGGITGVNTGRIENCVIKEDTVISRDGVFCGGIAGISYILEDDIYNEVQPGIYGCTNYAKINCKKRSYKLTCGATGGIVGLSKMASDDAKAVEAMTPQLENCENYGSVTSVGAATGGIVGLCSDTKISECTNYGTVTQEESLWTGGIVGSFNQENFYGEIHNGNDNIFFINKCRNEGFIQGVSRVGGIVGGDESYSNSLHTQALMNMNDCINTGDIYTTGFGGGLSGYSYSDINRSINTGDVYMDLLGQNHEQQGQNAIGGITSRTSKSISDCINIGAVQINTDETLPFTTYVGGIVGVVESVGDIDNCYNSGSVEGTHISMEGETTTVYYGGIAGTGSVSKITKCAFNNSVGMAEKSVGSYSGKDADEGLSLSQMTGKSALENMPSLFKNGKFKVAKNVIKEGVNYYLTPVLKNMPTLYELDAEKTIESAACAYLKVELPTGTGYTVVPLDGYNEDKVQIKGDFQFKVVLDKDHSDYVANVTVDQKELKPNDEGVYIIEELEDAPIIRVVITKHTSINPTAPTTGGNGGSATKDTIDKAATPTGDTNSHTMFMICLMLLITSMVTIIVLTKNKSLERVD